MKKLFVLCVLCFMLSAFAYTSEDTANANYLADKGIVTKQTLASKYRLDDKILRQEVIAMALKIKGITIPTDTSCKKYFADATKNDWVCRAVELAADNGIITKANKYANPGKYVTRAEALAMVMKAGGVGLITDAELTKFKTQIENLKNNPEYEMPVRSVTDEFGTSVEWIQKLMLTAIQKIPEIYAPYASECLCTLEPNRLATRAEVFGFARSIIESKKTTCARVGEQISTVYTEYPSQCCSDLTVWNSGMDTRISIGNTCYETGMMAGSPVDTCLACGDNICSGIETPCNCPQDCKNGKNADYAKESDFCLAMGSYSDICTYMDLPLCHLCQ